MTRATQQLVILTRLDVTDVRAKGGGSRPRTGVASAGRARLPLERGRPTARRRRVMKSTVARYRTIWPTGPTRTSGWSRRCRGHAGSDATGFDYQVQRLDNGVSFRARGRRARRRTSDSLQDVGVQAFVADIAEPVRGARSHPAPAWSDATSAEAAVRTSGPAVRRSVLHSDVLTWPLLAPLRRTSASGAGGGPPAALRPRRGGLPRGDPGESLHLVKSGRFAVRVSVPSGDTATLSVLVPATPSASWPCCARATTAPPRSSLSRPAARSC